MPVMVHPPNADDFPADFDIDSFMGTWYVTHSTLSLWKSRKDVTITYAPVSSSSSAEPKFDDVVEYRSRKASPKSTRSRVVGLDTAIPTTSANSSAPPTRYKWRGRGWLAIASSRWQVLAYSRLAENAPRDGADADAAAAEAPTDWALTYFEKTLFTPAGLDVYCRSAGGMSPELAQEIIAQAKAVGGSVGALADKFFEVEHST